MSRPSSRAFNSIDDRPAISETTKRVPLPTATGSMCSYASARRARALACSPALWANAEAPTYGCWGSGTQLTISATRRETEVSSSSRSGGSVATPIFRLRLAMIGTRSQLPVRSP